MRLGKISPAYGHCQPTIDIFCGATALANVSKILCVNVSKILCVEFGKCRRQLQTLPCDLKFLHDFTGAREQHPISGVD